MYMIRHKINIVILVKEYQKTPHECQKYPLLEQREFINPINAFKSPNIHKIQNGGMQQKRLQKSFSMNRSRP